MSRSGSAKGSRKGSAKKGAKTPKQQVKELTEQNSVLMSELDLLRANQSLLTEKLVDITKKITDGIDKKKMGITENTDLTQLNTQVKHLIVEYSVLKIHDANKWPNIACLKTLNIIVWCAHQVVLDMIASMIVKKKTYDMSVEARADQLENRVTKMNMENAKMLRKTAAYECGLTEVMNCSDVEQVRDRVYQLQLIAGN